MSRRPYENDYELSHILVGTTWSPGICKLSGHKRTLAWDVKAAKGQVGASSTLGGQPLGDFTATFTLSDDSIDPDSELTDFDQWEEFARLLWSTVRGAKPVALPIYHPDLADNLYTEIVLREMGEMVHDGKGGATIAVKLGEHKPPKPKPAAKAETKPAQTYATTDEGRRSPPDPNAAAKEELAGLLDEARKP